MDLWDIIILLTFLVSGGITLFGGYYESEDKRRKFINLTPRQIVFLGGIVTVITSVFNTVKTNGDSKKLSNTITDNIQLTRKIQSATSENYKLVKIAAELAQLNYKLSENAQRLSKISIIKADTILSKANSITDKTQNIINNSTGGDSFCFIDVIPFDTTVRIDMGTGMLQLINPGRYPVRNLRIYPSEECDVNIGQEKGTLGFSVKIDVVIPNKPIDVLEIKTDNGDFSRMMDPDITNINFHRVKISYKETNRIYFEFLTDYKFWYQRTDLKFINNKWHKSVKVYASGGKLIHNKKYIF